MTAERRSRPQGGQILPLFALMLVLLLLPVTALAVDGGLLLSTHGDLEASAQSAAEAGAQAVDVTALDRSGEFQLCVAPDGGTDCGNGVGNVLQVVAASVSSGVPGAQPNCALVSWAALVVPGGRSRGCEVAVRAVCAAAAGPDTGVQVLVWRTVDMPLLSLGPWGSLVLRAQATAWLTHGYAQPDSGVSSSAPC